MSEQSEREKICADFLSIVLYSRCIVFTSNFKDFFLAEHKIWRTRTICTFVGVPRTRVRRTEYPLKRSESGVPKRGGGIASLFAYQIIELKDCVSAYIWYHLWYSMEISS